MQYHTARGERRSHAKLYRHRDSRAKTGTILDVVRPFQVGDAGIDASISPMLASTNRFGVDLLPGHPRLSIVEDTLSQAWSEAAGGKIGGLRKSNWCAALCTSLAERYDVIFFDIGPSLRVPQSNSTARNSVFRKPYGGGPL